MKTAIKVHHHEELLAPAALTAIAGGLPALGIVACVLGVVKTMGAIDQPPTVLGALTAAPDGATLDAEGAVWFADAVGHRVVRMASGGEILETISTGEQGAFACALGGPDGHTLFICVAPDFHEHARQAAREAAIWTTRVGVPGAGRP